MHNWDYDLTTGKGEEFERWKLERMINYGLGPDEKLPEKRVRQFWQRLQIAPDKRRFLELLLWKK